MKRYVSGFLFFFFLTSACLLTLFWMTRGVETEEAQKVQATESIEYPAFADSGGETGAGIGADNKTEIETETMVHVVLNQEDVIAKTMADKYCLVAEEGYLIVYDSDRETVNLFTHMPLTEFPVPEQEKLMEGIWFGTMAEVFSYLESYSS